MIPRLPLFAPANRRKPKYATGGTLPAVPANPDNIPAVLTPYPPERTVQAPRRPSTAPAVQPMGELATATRYGPIPAPSYQISELGIAWRMNESEHLAVLAELGGDLAAHLAVQTMASPVNGCQHCGVPDREPHGQRWTEAAGWHGWTAPTQEQIKARMIARRADRIMTKQG